MFRFTFRDVLWLIAMAALAGAWWLDHSFLAINLNNCRFVQEHQRQTINAMSKPTVSP
jgi:hypothetical protein